MELGGKSSDKGAGSGSLVLVPPIWSVSQTTETSECNPLRIDPQEEAIVEMADQVLEVTPRGLSQTTLHESETFR